MSSLTVRPYNPSKPRKARVIRDSEWNQYRSSIVALHLEGVTQDRLLELLKNEHDFHPTKSQLVARLGRWNLFTRGRLHPTEGQTNASATEACTSETDVIASGLSNVVQTSVTPATQDQVCKQLSLLAGNLEECSDSSQVAEPSVMLLDHQRSTDEQDSGHQTQHTPTDMAVDPATEINFGQLDGMPEEAHFTVKAMPSKLREFVETLPSWRLHRLDGNLWDVGRTNYCSELAKDMGIPVLIQNVINYLLETRGSTTTELLHILLVIAGTLLNVDKSKALAVYEYLVYCATSHPKLASQDQFVFGVLLPFSRMCRTLGNDYWIKSSFSARAEARQCIEPAFDHVDLLSRLPLLTKACYELPPWSSEIPGHFAIGHVKVFCHSCPVLIYHIFGLRTLILTILSKPHSAVYMIIRQKLEDRDLHGALVYLVETWQARAHDNNLHSILRKLSKGVEAIPGVLLLLLLELFEIWSVNDDQLKVKLEADLISGDLGFVTYQPTALHPTSSSLLQEVHLHRILYLLLREADNQSVTERSVDSALIDSAHRMLGNCGPLLALHLLGLSILSDSPEISESHADVTLLKYTLSAINLEFLKQYDHAVSRYSRASKQLDILEHRESLLGDDHRPSKRDLILYLQSIFHQRSAPLGMPMSSTLETLPSLFQTSSTLYQFDYHPYSPERTDNVRPKVISDVLLSASAILRSLRWGNFPFMKEHRLPNPDIGAMPAGIFENVYLPRIPVQPSVCRLVVVSGPISRPEEVDFVEIDVFPYHPYDIRGYDTVGPDSQNLTKRGLIDEWGSNMQLVSSSPPPATKSRLPSPSGSGHEVPSSSLTTSQTLLQVYQKLRKNYKPSTTALQMRGKDTGKPTSVDGRGSVSPSTFVSGAYDESTIARDDVAVLPWQEKSRDSSTLLNDNMSVITTSTERSDLPPSLRSFKAFADRLRTAVPGRSKSSSLRMSIETSSSWSLHRVAGYRVSRTSEIVEPSSLNEEMVF